MKIIKVNRKRERLKTNVKTKLLKMWTELKDLALLLLLLNLLIGILSDNVDWASRGSKVVIYNSVQAEEIKRSPNNEGVVDTIEKSEPEILVGEFSAYTASEAETDADPETMASGKKVYVGAIACPVKYELGTKLTVNGKTYTCEDRMAERFRDKENFDIYFESYNDAVAFGRRFLEYQLVN